MCTDPQYTEILDAYSDLISEAVELLKDHPDPEHTLSHTLEVVENTKYLMQHLNQFFEPAVCVLAAYWHDVGRTVQDAGHEQISACMLQEQLMNRGYSSEFIELCGEAIVHHKWSGEPKTKEGLIIQDADKLAWVSVDRWKTCLDNGATLDAIVQLLPNLRNSIFNFEITKQLYDQRIVELVAYLHERVIALR